MAMRVDLKFVGCRLNEAEIEHMARQFAARGDEISPKPGQADMVVVNTCAVTKDATRKSRQMILQAGRANPGAQIVVTGCYAELDPDTIGRLPGVTRVIGNRDKDRLVDLTAPGDIPIYDTEPISRELPPPGTLGHTRAFVKVQDGCDNRCTFCVTTLLRGAGHSRALDDIIREINALSGAGYREVVLTGVHLGSYGHDRGEVRGLARLVEHVLGRTTIPRLRLSSLEPWDLDPEFFDLWCNPRLCPHIHLPLQSGCDATLRRMARRTTQESFVTLVEAARACIPDLSITGDIIVGFPGETEAEFAESIAFIKSIGFARLHVFGYSMRPGTAAAKLPGHMSERVKNERRAAMSSLSDRLWTDFESRHIGHSADVLWESAHGATPDGFIWSGHTSNYVRVYTTSRATLYNTITKVQIAGLTSRGLVAVAG
jgi:threonylcarbamoyladenosine tRNA methylthiotransferase MtaB